MRTDNTTILRCVDCGAAKTVRTAAATDTGGVIREGLLICSACGAEYPVRRGIVDFLRPDDMTPLRRTDQENCNQSDRSVDQMHREGTMPREMLDGELDYMFDTFSRTEFLFRWFDYDNPGSRRVLDLGCGDPVLAHKFAELGFQVWGVDFAEERLALGDRYIQGDADDFERGLALMSRLPFIDGAFDVVFMHASLHHSTPTRESEFAWFNANNLHDTLKEIRRVLKPAAGGGALILAGEGTYPEGLPPESRKLEERAKIDGCYESFYTLSEYLSQFSRVGLYPTLWAQSDGGFLVLDHFTPKGRRNPILSKRDQTTAFRNTPVFDFKLRSALDAVLPTWIRADCPRLTRIGWEPPPAVKPGDPECRPYLVAGWQAGETDSNTSWAWAGRGPSVITVPMRQRTDHTVSLTCFPFNDPTKSGPQILRIVFNGVKVASLELQPSVAPQMHSLRLPGHLVEEINEFAFLAAWESCPADLGPSPDRRSLAVQFFELGLSPLSS